MSEESEGLFAIGVSCTNEDRAADIIFVHGLNGDKTQSWEPLPSANTNGTWLTWLCEDAPSVGVWTYGYNASHSHWHGKTMPFRDRATNLIDWIESRNLGGRPLIFVCHSLGGIIIKALLDIAWADNRSLLNDVTAVLLLGTPHAGSPLANWFSFLGPIGRKTVSADELHANNVQLHELAISYREVAKSQGISTKSYYETLPTNGVIVVDATSSDPGIAGSRPIAVLKNHISISRPSSKDDLVYLGSLSFINQAIVNRGRDRHERVKIKDKTQDFVDVAILALAEQAVAEIALGNTANIMRYADVVAALERRAREAS